MFVLVFLQESESGGDSGYPSERRSEGDPNDHVDGVCDNITTLFKSIILTAGNKRQL